MTPFPFSVEIDESLDRARELMQEHGIRHLPVTRAGELLGIVSARDIEILENALPAGALTVETACTREAYVIDLSARLDRVLIDMAERHVEAALVVKHGRLAGIFTATDVYGAFGELLKSEFPETGGDDAA